MYRNTSKWQLALEKNCCYVCISVLILPPPIWHCMLSANGAKTTLIKLPFLLFGVIILSCIIINLTKALKDFWHISWFSICQVSIQFKFFSLARSKPCPKFIGRVLNKSCPITALWCSYTNNILTQFSVAKKRVLRRILSSWVGRVGLFVCVYRLSQAIEADRCQLLPLLPWVCCLSVVPMSQSSSSTHKPG